MSVKSQSLGRNRNRMVDSTPYTPTHTSNYATIPANQGLVKLKKSYSTAPNSVYREVSWSNIETLYGIPNLPRFGISETNPIPNSTKAVRDSLSLNHLFLESETFEDESTSPENKFNDTLLSAQFSVAP